MNKPKATLQEIADRHGVYAWQNRHGSSWASQVKPDRCITSDGVFRSEVQAPLSLFYEIPIVDDYTQSLCCPTPEIKQPPEGYEVVIRKYERDFATSDAWSVFCDREDGWAYRLVQGAPTKSQAIREWNAVMDVLYEKES